MTANEAMVPISEAAGLAKVLAKSALIPEELRGKEADVLVTILTGRELGIGPMASLRSIYVYRGRPGLNADLMVAIALRSGVCEYFDLIESSDTRAEYETKRVGRPAKRMVFSMAQAQQAQLSGQQWTKFPAAMLRARCKAALARDVYPDCLAGVYETSELQSTNETAVVCEVEPAAQAEQDPGIEALSARIAQAESLDALSEVLPALKALEEGEAKRALRVAYLEASKELREQAPATEG